MWMKVCQAILDIRTTYRVLGLIPRVYEWAGLWRNLKIYIPDKFLSDTDAATMGITFWESLDR